MTILATQPSYVNEKYGQKYKLPIIFLKFLHILSVEPVSGEAC